MPEAFYLILGIGEGAYNHLYQISFRQMKYEGRL